MNKEQFLKTLDLIKEHNKDLYSKLNSIKRVLAGKSKTNKQVTSDELCEVLIMTSIMLSANIKVRYDLEDWLKENKAFANLSQLKSITTSCKQDCENLKSISYSMTEVLKTIRQKEENQRYKEQTY